MKIDRLELTEVPLRLKFPFRTSFGVEQDRRIIILQLSAGGVTGLSECVAAEFPGYSAETTDTAWHVLSDFIAPRVVGRSFANADELLNALAFIRGHDMAVAAVEMAFWDLQARAADRPLFELLGGTDRPVEVGISLGIQDSLEETVEAAAAGIEAGYRRVKLKIEPGWDIAPVGAVREAFPDIPLTVDANSAYTLSDAEHLARLDAFSLSYMEQPLRHDDIVDHATLQTRIATRVCLDESVTSPESARQALQLGSARVINMKVGRVRGFRQALAIHDLTRAWGVPLWCGGMLESGIGRAANLHLSSLPNFRLPGDTSSSSRYWDRDIINEPLEATDGLQAIPRNGPGSGVTLDDDYVASIRTRTATFS